MDDLSMPNTAIETAEPVAATQTQAPSSLPYHNMQHRQRQRSFMYGAPSRTVRTNWIAFLRTSWRTMSRTNKIIIGITAFISLAEIVITIIMLVLGREEQCDKPLDTYLIVFVIRLGFSMPLTLYKHLWRTVSVSDSTGNRSTNTISARPSPVAGPNNSQPMESSSPTTLSHTDHATTEAEATTQVNSVFQTSSNTRSWVDGIKSFLDLISILWFVVGNYFIFTASSQCYHDAKYLFYTTMTWILLGYFLVLVPLLLCAGVVFCLPCLIVAMRYMNIDYATGMIGANNDEIQSIPIYKYRSLSSTERQAQDSPYTSTPLPTTVTSTSSSKATHQSSKRRKLGILTYFTTHRNSLQDTDVEQVYEELTMDPADSLCTICLSDYENGELICRLRCNHHFHKDCVHEWLALNYKCPLCQRDFRQIKSNDEDGGKTDSDNDI
ncbi:hypothetical protein BC941DRAFT_422916 [Chlamydoabsidia padenii]|nr:hypothetical protein BC941DRAFT_422916 [Chlamydoabsidia padenii]